MSAPIPINPAVDYLTRAEGFVMVALNRLGAFDTENEPTAGSVMASIGHLDGSINLHEARDRIGLIGEVLHLVIRKVVAEERIEAAQR